MDKICLHPQAQDWLFEYYRALRLIFNDVLGHLELDYLSMTLLNPSHELLFFSSQPSIEQNLIEHNLWQIDPCIQLAHLSPMKNFIWNDIYQQPSLTNLRHYKLQKPKLEFVFSKSVLIDNYSITYAFGVKSLDPGIHINLLNQTNVLLSIGKFCLQNIFRELDIDFFPPSFLKNNPHLKLVVNNFRNT